MSENFKNNQIQVFENNEFGAMRTALVDDEVWFVGKDVADILGYVKARNAIATHVDEDDALKQGLTDELGRTQETILINESGLYSLILSSKLPTAKRFKHWVTSEVLPSIRKHGAYLTADTLESLLGNPDFAIRLLTEIKNEREKVRLKDREIADKSRLIDKLKPKADYTDKVLESERLISITQIAKDYGMSAVALNMLLHQEKVQYRRNGQWVLYSKFQNKGYTASVTVKAKKCTGSNEIVLLTKWTQKGRLFLYRFLKRRGILPTSELDIDSGN